MIKNEKVDREVQIVRVLSLHLEDQVFIDGKGNAKLLLLLVSFDVFSVENLFLEESGYLASSFSVSEAEVPLELTANLRAHPLSHFNSKRRSRSWPRGFLLVVARDLTNVSNNRERSPLGRWIAWSWFTLKIS